MAAAGQNFELHQGDRRQIVIPVYDENDAILDLTSYNQITWVVYKQTTKELILTKTLSDGISVPTPANGEIVIDLLPVDTENLNPSAYNHECEISDGGTTVYTVATGTMKLLYSKA